MTVESASYISQLSATLPSSTDPKSEGDDHLRLLKSVLQTQFPNLGANAVTPTAAQINDVPNKAVKTGDTYSGTHDMTAATLNVATQTASDNSTKAASTAQVQSAILASSGITASLPGQAGNAGKFLQTNGSSASWASSLPTQTGNNGKFLTTNGTTESWGSVTPSGLVLLATLTPTVAANVDFLNTFSSTYDNYLIHIDGVKPSADDALVMRLAVSGSAVSSSVYFESTNAQTSTGNTFHSIHSAFLVTSAGKGINARSEVFNANDASNGKMINTYSSFQNAATPTFYNSTSWGAAFNSSSILSGFRLYWSSASNFQATGKVRVYGYSNT